MLNTPDGDQTTSGNLSGVSTRRMAKKRRMEAEAEAEREVINMAGNHGTTDSIALELSNYSIKETAHVEAESYQQVCS